MYKLLNNINDPNDLKKLTCKQLKELANEIRNFLITTISETGGHLASNLGIVDLTIALHKVFTTPKDKIIWDVGHQTYVHKILTNRKDKLKTLRNLGGLSGFPKTSESKHDIFNTGHSSTSISAALGISKAMKINNEENSVIAVIGDGALTGGMAFEALNDAGRSPNNLIVILNDNEMSITKNVGGLSKYLTKIRTEPAYYKVKQDIDYILNRIPTIGKRMVKTMKRAKSSIKHMMIPGIIFEELGFTYVGPIDGHDIFRLIDVLNKAKRMTGPILIHAYTKKGKGYSFAEEKPDVFHGISSFDIKTGRPNNIKENAGYSEVFGEKLIEIGKKDKRLVTITAAMPKGTGLDKFSKMFPDRFFDVGIAEQHAVTFAAGLAISQLKPVVAIYSSFLQRAYDQIMHDVALQNLNVIFAIDRAGIVGADGETHQGVFDLSFLNHIPNMTIMAPSCYKELEDMLEYAVLDHTGPIAIRYPKGYEEMKIKYETSKVLPGKGEILVKGNDISIIAVGKMVPIAMEVAVKLKKVNINAEVINLKSIKPIDKSLILKSAIKTSLLITLEDNAINGGVGNTILNLLNDSDYNNIKVKIKGYPDSFIPHGSIEELFNIYNMDADSIVKDIEKLIKKKLTCVTCLNY